MHLSVSRQHVRELSYLETGHLDKMASTVLKVVLLILALINAKSLPLAFHARFFYYMAKHFYVFKRVKAKSVFEPRQYSTHTPLMEIDFNLHKSNSTYFTDLDMARTDLMMHVFKDYFLHYQDSENKTRDGKWPYCPLGGVVSVFRHEIKPYSPYKVRSRILGWDNKWIFVISRFESGKKLHAIALSKYVFKMRRKTVPPEEVLKFCGLADEETLKQGKMDFDKAEHFLHLENLEHESI
ncbi:hypothetical protein AWJ20_1032 [Sugiyamaella lignohabitans]|uniref:Uncharacterized protein n=1 Tax=Sugiyamaella lignohabitans TaxID=796027 RepID=A0A167DCI9_9ASCO|nr:uncharacterized protein AWJ20_1032 [Sugiyamaella lignohabitans]ANB12762.1 hypothetical protein AWJ20_1032 [Sugiyamaella lignohabitans]